MVNTFLSKTALVTGITGQDGAWLAALLLEKGYKVIWLARRASDLRVDKLDRLGITEHIKIVEFDLSDYSNMWDVIHTYKPDEFYNLAAQSFVGVSFKQPISTSEVDGMWVAKILDILKHVSPQTRFYQASTSEMFGKVQETPQTETTPFYPRSPYGCAKLFAHWMTVNYRESYNMFCCSGILFNHESELRGKEFVTRKITSQAAVHKDQITRSEPQKIQPIQIGNIDAQRDWGYAKEYVEGMWRMLQQDTPDDYVLATGETTTVRKFVDYTYLALGIKTHWEGKWIDEVLIHDESGMTLLEINPDYFRPAEVDILLGSPEKAKKILKWQPKTNVQELAKIMALSDYELLKQWKL